MLIERIAYWGITCRTCRESVAFDAPPYYALGPGAPNVRPGAIRCTCGHSHVYYPRDFSFFPSPIPITDAAMSANRAAFVASNPPPERYAREYAHR
jgi:hypothetical protein